MKKLISVFVSSAMILSSMTGVFAESELEKVLKNVKSKIEIPSNLTEFTPASETYDGVTNYVFNWYTDDDDDKYPEKNQFVSMFVYADSDGNIKNMSMNYNSDSKYGKLPSVSKTDAEEFAKESVKKLSPEFAENVKIEKTTVYTGYAPSYRVTFGRYENGIKVDSDGISANVAEYDGKPYIANYNVNWFDGEFAAAENLMGEDKFREFIKNNSPLELNYHDTYQNGNKKITLQYSLNDEPVYFDAQTGEKVITDDYYSEYLKEDAAVTASGGTANDIFTEEELSEINEIGYLADKEKAEEYIRSIPQIAVTQDMTVDSFRTTKRNGEYRYIFSFTDAENKKYISVTLNAQDLEIYRINSYDDSEKISLQSVKENDDKAKIDEFLKKYYGEKANELLYVNDNEKNSDIHTASYSYHRTINGIPYYDNGINLRYNSKADKIESLTFEWDKLEEVPSEKDIYTAEQAAEMLSLLPIKTTYVISGESKPVIAYTFDGSADFDAKSGQRVNYDGSPYTEEFIGYTDIDGHWSADMVNSLVDMDIYIDGTEFEPETNITQLEYLTLIAMSEGRYNNPTEERVYKYAINNGIIPAEEKNPNGYVSKEQAVMYLLKSKKYNEVAELKGIFVCDFADSEQIDESILGYIAIAKGLGYISGDGGGNFKPKKEITRAEAAAIIYNSYK